MPKQFWKPTGLAIIKLIEDFFINNKMNNNINKTRIVLIPKINNPYLITHYRPISLCNVTYKIICNIIVTRLRPLLNNLISPYQNAFVPKRQITDNIALAHELIHTMKLKKTKTTYIALKIDLEKAYDKLEWNFIKNALTHINLASKMIEWIMLCIQTVSFDITLNGDITER